MDTHKVSEIVKICLIQIFELNTVFYRVFCGLSEYHKIIENE